MEHYIYVVFSATPYKMGRFIRKITRQQYNHVSVALDEKLEEMYSFARHYQDTPLYGGFVEESQERYYYKSTASKVKVYAIPLDATEYEKVNGYIERMKINQEEYIYNTISAICTLFRYRVHIDKSYTCTEFAVNVLAHANTGLQHNAFYSIEDLENEFQHCMIYQGDIESIANTNKNTDEQFLVKHGIIFRCYNTGILFSKLIIRMWKQKIVF